MPTPWPRPTAKARSRSRRGRGRRQEGERGEREGWARWRQRLDTLSWTCCRLVLPPFARQLPAREVLDFLPKIRSQTRASFRSRAARAFRLSRRLFRFSASVDHQMTPALFAGLFALSRFRPAHWRTGCRARLRRPSDLKHHAASREGGGVGSSVGQNCALHLGALSEGRLTPFSSRITPRRVEGGGWLTLGRTAPCAFGTLDEGCCLHLRPKCPGVLRPLATSRSSPPRTASTLRLLAPSPRAGSLLFRWQFPEALPPETRGTANAWGVSARRQDPALRASAHGPCDVRDGDAGRNRSSRLFPKAGRSRKHGSPRPPKEGVLRGDGRGCRRGNAVSHNAPAFPRLEDSALNKLD